MGRMIIIKSVNVYRMEQINGHDRNKHVERYCRKAESVSGNGFKGN